MKSLSIAVLAAAAVAFCSIGPASALPPAETTTCTTTTLSNEVPSGTYVDSHGTKWAGYKSNGMPPDSLSSGGGNETTCVTVINEVT